MRVKSKLNAISGNTLDALRILHRMYPFLIPTIMLAQLLVQVMPYASIYFLGKLMSTLQENSVTKEILVPLILLLFAETLVTLINSLMTRVLRLASSKYTNLKNRAYARQFALVSMEEFECPDMHQFYANIRAREQGGFGLPRTKLMFERCWEGLVNLTAGLLTLYALQNIGTIGMTINRYVLFLYICISLILVIVLPLLSSWLKAKADSYWEKDPVLDNGSRLFAFCYRFAFDIKKALEVRLFQQHRLVLHEMSKDTLYTPRGKLYQYAKGPMGIFNTLSITVGELAIAMIYVFVFVVFRRETLDVGVLVSLMLVCIRLSQSISTMAEGISISRHNAQAIKDTVSFLDIEEEQVQEQERVTLESIHIENLSYTYSGSETCALDHVSLVLEAGKTYAVVGPNGSGKSTFVKILSGFYQNYEGRICLNGHVEACKDLLRSHASAVFQDFGLLSGTIAENIACSKVYDPTSIEDVLSVVGFSLEPSAFPLGIHTPLQKNFAQSTRSVSGGEAQKIAMARALYRNRPLFFMDEPTAALDPIAEESIYRNLKAIVEGKTAVFVSHRLASCTFCDEILVFEKGRIVQRGTHKDLLMQDGLYSVMWKAQANYYQDERL